jgi:ankyrin repeat protein
MVDIIYIMNYEEKYLKYKKKYLELKNQLGGVEEQQEDKSFSLVNTRGSCWNIAISMILLVGDKTRDEITEKARNYTSEEIFESGKELLNRVLGEIIRPESKRENLIGLIDSIKRRLGIFYHSSRPVLGITIEPTREKALLTCELDFNSNYNRIVDKPENREGGYDYDKFILSNLISIFFLNKLVNIVYHRLNNYKPIPIQLIENCAGVYVSKFNFRNMDGTTWDTGHAISFYKYFGCDKFCNNDTIINYDWDEMLRTYNRNLSSHPQIFYDETQTDTIVLKGSVQEHSYRRMITIPIEQRVCEGRRGTILTAPESIDYSKYMQIGTLSFLQIVEPTDIERFKSDNIIQFIRFKASTSSWELSIFIRNENLANRVINDYYESNTRLAFIFASDSYNGIASAYWPDDDYQTLLSTGVDLSVQNSLGQTPIMVIVQNDLSSRREIAKSFNYGSLGMAYQFRNNETFNKVMSYLNKDILSIRDNEGNTIIDYAVNCKHPELYLPKILEHNIIISGRNFIALLTRGMKDKAISLLNYNLDLLKDDNGIPLKYIIDNFNALEQINIFTKILAEKPDILTLVLKDGSIDKPLFLFDLFKYDGRYIGNGKELFGQIIDKIAELKSELMNINYGYEGPIVFELLRRYRPEIIIKFLQRNKDILFIQDRYRTTLLEKIIQKCNKYDRNMDNSILYNYIVENYLPDAKLTEPIEPYTTKTPLLETIKSGCIDLIKKMAQKLGLSIFQDKSIVETALNNLSAEKFLELSDEFGWEIKPEYIFNKIMRYDTYYFKLLSSRTGFDVNMKDPEGNTILMYAIIHMPAYGTRDRMNMIDEIIKLNPDFNAVNNEGQSVYSLAKSAHLLNYFGTKQIKFKQQTNCLLLLEELEKKPLDLEKINRILDEGTETNCVNLNNQTILMLAIKSRNTEIVNRIKSLSDSTSLNLKDSDGNTTINYSIIYDIPEVFESILETMTESEIRLLKNNNKMNILHQAVTSPNPLYTQSVLSKITDNTDYRGGIYGIVHLIIDDKDINDNTPLMTSVLAKRPRNSMAILQNPIKPNLIIKNKYGAGILILALGNNKVIIKREGRPDEEHNDIMKPILQNIFDNPTFYDYLYLTPETEKTKPTSPLALAWLTDNKFAFNNILNGISTQKTIRDRARDPNYSLQTRKSFAENYKKLFRQTNRKQNGELRIPEDKFEQFEKQIDTKLL